MGERLSQVAKGMVAAGATALLCVVVASGSGNASATGSTSTTTVTTTTSVTTTTTAVTTTTAAAPTTTAGPALAAEVAPPGVASRGTSFQATDTLPPPPTTTTPPTLPPETLPADSGSGRRVVYSKSAQRVWIVEGNGTVARTYLVSGRLTWNQPTPGTYSVFSRSAFTCNITRPHICWRYMVRFTKGPDGDNIGFHEIPTNNNTGRRVQSEDELGQPLSGGCVRQATADAQFMWNWAYVGTKVVVLG